MCVFFEDPDGVAGSFNKNKPALKCKSLYVCFLLPDPDSFWGVLKLQSNVSVDRCGTTF